MRLEPIDKPTGLMMRIAFWVTRRKFGKVMTTMKVLFPRVPKMVKLFYEIQKFETNGMRLERGLHFMIATLVSHINGCGSCVDIARSMAIRENLNMEKFNALSEYGTSPLFSDRERAALAFVEEATRSKRVSDARFEALRRHFSEWEIVEITWLNAAHNYYNLINVPLEIESDGFCAIAEAQMASNGRLPNTAKGSNLASSGAASTRSRIVAYWVTTLVLATSLSLTELRRGVHIQDRRPINPSVLLVHQQSLSVQQICPRFSARPRAQV